jgi:eukaryotic-like serine/threonine-protein kinase
MALTRGTRLGPYEIIALLGVGGMGEVYRARDTKLDRDIAIKVLPQVFAADPERIARFQREAKTLASLNHPHIAAIYGIEESGGTHALVMELIEGEDLSQRIARGPIPIEEVLSMAKQIAEALEAAHEQGIIHRDLKPANIEVTTDGNVKVLDFGLAKLSEPLGSGPQAAGSLSLSPTITSPALMTGAGVLLGTAAYMSPEQAKGRPADKRSDVWAFGCVLYEMLTGEAPFARETVSDSIAAILEREPDFARLPSAKPAGLPRLLTRCLAKDRQQRLRDVGDARLEIDEWLASPSATASVVKPSKS